MDGRSRARRSGTVKVGDGMIPSPNHSGRGGKQVRLIVIHTAEGARTVESLGAWFQRSNPGVSSHAGIDDKRIETYVDYSQQAFTVRSGNAISDNVELCGFAAWTRTQWLGEHRRMLELAAQWIAERCKARGIPIRKLTPAEVKAGQAGVCGHIDWTLGMKDGSHTDPGPSFPWDEVIRMAGGVASQPTPSEVDGLSAQFEKDARARWGKEDLLERDLRADLAVKQKQIDGLVVAVKTLTAKVDALAGKS